MYTRNEIAQALDLAVLRPTARAEDVLWACELVRKTTSAPSASRRSMRDLPSKKGCGLAL